MKSLRLYISFSNGICRLCDAKSMPDAMLEIVLASDATGDNAKLLDEDYKVLGYTVYNNGWKYHESK